MSKNKQLIISKEFLNKMKTFMYTYAEREECAKLNLECSKIFSLHRLSINYLVLN